MISCYKLGPELTNFILNAFAWQFECSSKFLVLKISLLFNIAIIFAFFSFIAIICLDLISVEIAARCTFKRKWNIQGQYRLRVSTYWKCKKVQTKSLNWTYIHSGLCIAKPFYNTAISNNPADIRPSTNVGLSLLHRLLR